MAIDQQKSGKGGFVGCKWLGGYGALGGLRPAGTAVATGIRRISGCTSISIHKPRGDLFASSSCLLADHIFSLGC